MGENIHLEKHVADGVAVIRLDRPKVNALSSDMMRDLHAICDELAVDEDLGVVAGARPCAAHLHGHIRARDRVSTSTRCSA